MGSSWRSLARFVSLLWRPRKEQLIKIEDPINCIIYKIVSYPQYLSGILVCHRALMAIHFYNGNFLRMMTNLPQLKIYLNTTCVAFFVNVSGTKFSSVVSCFCMSCEQNYWHIFFYTIFLKDMWIANSHGK